MQFILWFCVFVSATFASRPLETVYEWRYIDYLWDSNEQKEQFIKSGDYDHKKIVPIDVDKAKDGRIFITVIKNHGVPATLATVTQQADLSGPLLRPYPDWSWHHPHSCDGITNVYRVAIDDCNKLYVLDNGHIGSNFTCPQQILIFDLGTDKLIERIRIPKRVSQNKYGDGKLVTPVIEFSGPQCELENIFMADVNGWGLVIWNRQRGIFRLESRVYHPQKEHVNVNIAGESFELEDSLMGMALSPKPSNGEEGRDLTFRPFSSRDLYAADSRVLARSTYGDTIKYKQGQYMLSSQATAMGFSEAGTLFFGLTNEIAVGCWHRSRDMRPANVAIAVQDRERLQFASGLKVLPRSRTKGSEEVWILTNRLQKIMSGTQNFNEVNYRVLKSSVDNLVRGTVCEPPTLHIPSSHQYT